jgi:hypothetical protein
VLDGEATVPDAATSASRIARTDTTDQDATQTPHALLLSANRIQTQKREAGSALVPTGFQDRSVRGAASVCCDDLIPAAAPCGQVTVANLGGARGQDVPAELRRTGQSIINAPKPASRFAS